MGRTRATRCGILVILEEGNRGLLGLPAITSQIRGHLAEKTRSGSQWDKYALVVVQTDANKGCCSQDTRPPRDFQRRIGS